MSLIVFGSINLDLVTKTPRLPVPGESVTGHNFFTAFGGKGANQAVMAARLGMTTYMVGRVGNDTFGQELLTSLQAGRGNLRSHLGRPIDSFRCGCDYGGG
jgi:ribokinase